MALTIPTGTSLIPADLGQQVVDTFYALVPSNISPVITVAIIVAVLGLVFGLLFRSIKKVRKAA